MFYKMITTARDRWYNSAHCTVNSIVDYIIASGKMRDVQIDAIKTYLFLKIGCKNKPLHVLFSDGFFNNIDLDDAEISNNVRGFLSQNTAAAALYEYACLKNDKGEQVSAKIENQIKKEPTSIDYERFFLDTFYGVSYTDYLFSLPMGAGKTYLMAAFIYLDLYFAVNEPANPAFAHNFIILAPSGLKSSVVPSLKTIQKFDPSWILPEPAANDIRKMISFEILDQSKTANKSNKTKNPNVQKIANHQPLQDVFGLVIVTNAEKVILDRFQEKDYQLPVPELSKDDKDRQANELRSLIGKMPALSVFIDEVHHAVSDEIKLRAVVTKWAAEHNVNSVIGFSGTPYLEKPEKHIVSDSLSVGTSEITNVVYYYPLIDGVDNFLKRPVVKIADISDSRLIIEKGVREFLDTYKDTVYSGGLTPKLGIYCGTIEKLEELVYPIVSRIASEYSLGTDTILRFHRGNKQYPAPAESPLQFEILDKPISKVRIILLVQIGKEGWDCRSLTGIILSQEGDCPTNMVLQTSCRCLRKVVKNARETALIYLNNSNAEKLKLQLKQQHHITLEEFSSADNSKTPLKRYDRTGYLNLPKIDFYQLSINYDSFIVEKAEPACGITVSADNARLADGIIRTTNLAMDESKTTISIDDTEYGCEPATFYSWIYGIMKGGLGTPSVAELMKFKDALKAIYDTITYEKDGSRYYSSKYDRRSVEANVRKAFCDKRGFTTIEALIPEEASLLNTANFSSEVYTDKPQDYYPDQSIVEKIIRDDNGDLKLDPEMEKTIRFLEKSGKADMAANLRKQNASHINKDRSFHYLPYRTDSSFEQTFLKKILSLDEIEKLGLEVYYNGDRALTEFKIKCYKQSGGRWKYIGIYTPDFLILRRKDGVIHKVIIVETKGEGYANVPLFKDRRAFMETEFSKQNNNAFGYERFEYLYLENTLSEKDRLTLTHRKICEFFKEES